MYTPKETKKHKNKKKKNRTETCETDRSTNIYGSSYCASCKRYDDSLRRMRERERVSERNMWKLERERQR